MSEPRMVQCVKLGREGEGLDRSPFKNALGQRIFESVSKEAWRGWIAHSTMLVNEYRVDVMSPSGREFLLKECDKYFFGEGSAAPKEFVAAGAPAQAPGAPEAPAASETPHTRDTLEPKG